MLPGLVMPPGLLGGETTAPSVLSFKGSAVMAGAGNVTFPFGISAGDLIVFADLCRTDGSSIPTTAPSGFSLLSATEEFQWSDGDQVGRIVIWYKIAAGSEGSTSHPGAVGTEIQHSNTRKIVAVFAATAISASAGGAVANHSTFAFGPIGSQSITAGSGAAPLVVIGTWRADDVHPERSMSVSDGEIDAGGGLGYLKYKIYNSSPANIAIATPSSATRAFQAGGYISVS